MSVRRVLATSALVLLAVSVPPATPADAGLVVQQTDVGAYTLTTGRLWPLVAIVLGLVGVFSGGLGLARSATRAGARNRCPFVALAAGLAGTVVGGLVVAAADGGPGTGYGIVGGWLALAIGLIGLVLSGLALARSRRAPTLTPSP
ncbi:MAG TPA: DUF6223 family protein [Microlunatus sp.]